MRDQYGGREKGDVVWEYIPSRVDLRSIGKLWMEELSTVSNNFIDPQLLVHGCLQIVFDGRK